MKNILIIEDDSSIAELQRDYLEAEGYLVDIESEGDKGLKLAMERTYDLFILDLMLPNINGFDICRHIRKEKDVPIIFVSAKKEDIDKIRGFGLGADDYLVKPFSPSELVARVKGHISRYERLIGKNGAKNKEIIVGNIQMDVEDRKVFVNGKEVMLTSKEFDLLLFLVNNPNHVFRKEELFERIWGYESVGDVATVTVHIRKLREKVESNSSSPQHIETIWGAGYRFKL
ncbi:response regulator transcription factor [Cytobacillus spongiae]|jgi:DNA-binding response OmpR family regulator|uniref:response regulator transcription factor n=1 Tax=Cytobacillus spongiae TaxID=2901381 RepID=UPI001F1800A5|nr:response regulator transcription factor [Cytobacillus spongiae]UII56326.1 response regulator transcription factor [Cytobacillus spongiae]